MQLIFLLDGLIKIQIKTTLQNYYLMVKISREKLFTHIGEKYVC